MSKPDHIKKIRPDPDGLDFDALKQEGIGLLQDLCGESWTDYNAHDPGVTILEQLCYGLTELAYRSDFDAEDYLTQKSGSIDYQQQALYAPQDILPSQAVTGNDYRKLIYDAIPEIDDIWFRPVVGDGQPGGLFSVFVRLDETLEELKTVAERDAVVERVRAFFAGHRSLAEDIHEVQLISTEHCYSLKGEVEISGECEPAALLAEIYFKCIRHISSSFRVMPYKDVHEQGKSLEQLFTGPLTRHGYIDDDSGGESRKSVTIAELTGLIRGVDGVSQVFRLGLVDADGNNVDSIEYDLSKPVFPCLPFPKSHDPNSLTILFRQSERGRRHAASERRQALFDEAERQFNKLTFEFQSSRKSRQIEEQVVPLPQGRHLVLHEYSSIQNQFPVIYAINRYGVPESAPPQRKAQAKQLKAYLFFFDQMMANYLQDLEQIPALFSVDAELSRSYFSQRLTNRELPGIEALYVNGPADTESAILNIVSLHDNFGDRRSRVLDYLLGLYGEDFSQTSLRRFNYYHGRNSDKWLIDNKIVFLKHIVELSRDRATAFNALDQSWGTGNIASLQKKVSILLGLRNFDTCRSLSGVLIDRKIRLVPDDLFEKGKTSLPVDQGQAMPPWPERHAVPATERTLLNGADEIGESLFRNGVDIDHFRLFSNGKKTRKAGVYFKHGNGKNARLQHLRTYDSDHAAVQAVHDFRRFIVQLNEECEGLHIVEHILLRPRGTAGRDGEHASRNFQYDFRISVIFPTWTARFHDREFRLLAEETVCRNCPAHIYPEFYWLDFVPMRDFEERYKKWLETLRTSHSDPDECNAASERLVAFLVRNRSKDGSDHHWV